MEWDQWLFRSALRLWQRIRHTGPDPAMVARRVSLEDEKKRLEVIAKALTGRPIQLHRAEQEGGRIGDIFFLPEQSSFFSTQEKNRDLYLFRVCFLSADLLLSYRFRRNKEGEEVREKEPELSVGEVLAWMKAQWPGMEDWSKALIEEAEEAQRSEDPQRMRCLFARSGDQGDLVDLGIYHDPLNPKQGEEEDEEKKDISERKAPPREKVEVLQIDKKTMQDYTLMHQFEKIETLDDFNGRWRDMDGADEMEAHEEALQELDMRQVVRADSVTHSVYQADFLASAAAPEVEGDQSTQPFLLYPEWDPKKKVLRPDHCKVYLEESDREDAEVLMQTLSSHRLTMQRLRKNLMRFRNMRQVLRRQTDGEFPDMDALIDAYGQRKAGRLGDDRVYLSRRLFRRDLAVSILMDISLSTDGYSGGRRVLDVEKQAVLMFGQLLQEQGEAFRIDAFWSKTRNQCHYIQIKDFRDGWTKASSRIGGLRPVGYTRIGPALRHATTLLRGQPARRRWILLLSDGKPNDYDRYEGQHGIADVRQAIREAEQAGVRVYALAVEQEARHYLPQMLGHANYQILSRPEELPEAMLFFYTRLLAS